MTIVKSRVERQFQEEWKGLIGIYLFLGGVGGGAYVVAGLGSLLTEAWAPVVTAGLWVSWLAVGIGILFLASHLGKPFRAPLAMSKLGSSWISRGVWILGWDPDLEAIHDRRKGANLHLAVDDFQATDFPDDQRAHEEVATPVG